MRTPYGELNTSLPEIGRKGTRWDSLLANPHAKSRFNIRANTNMSMILPERGHDSSSSPDPYPYGNQMNTV